MKCASLEKLTPAFAACRRMVHTAWLRELVSLASVHTVLRRRQHSCRWAWACFSPVSSDLGRQAQPGAASDTVALAAALGS